MTPLDPGHTNFRYPSMRARRLMLSPQVDRHVHHTHQMLVISAVAAMAMVGLAAMLIGAIS